MFNKSLNVHQLNPKSCASGLHSPLRHKIQSPPTFPNQNVILSKLAKTTRTGNFIVRTNTYTQNRVKCQFAVVMASRFLFSFTHAQTTTQYRTLACTQNVPLKPFRLMNISDSGCMATSFMQPELDDLHYAVCLQFIFNEYVFHSKAAP